MTLLFLPLSLAVGLGLGFACGLWAQARVSDLYWRASEERANRRVALAVQDAERKRHERQEAINRAKVLYGPHLQPDQDAVIEEEVERVLGAVRTVDKGGRGNGR